MVLVFFDCAVCMYGFLLSRANCLSVPDKQHMRCHVCVCSFCPSSMCSHVCMRMPVSHCFSLSVPVCVFLTSDETAQPLGHARRVCSPSLSFTRSLNPLSCWTCSLPRSLPSSAPRSLFLCKLSIVLPLSLSSLFHFLEVICLLSARTMRHSAQNDVSSEQCCLYGSHAKYSLLPCLFPSVHYQNIHMAYSH